LVPNPINKEREIIGRHQTLPRANTDRSGGGSTSGG
jgi:hypothetical protein